MQLDKQSIGGKTIMSFCFFLMGVYVIYSASKWPRMTGLFPFIMGITFTLLFAADLMLTLFSKKSAKAKHKTLDFKFSEDVDKAVATKRTIEAFCWLFAYFALVLVIGFVYAIPVFVGLYIKMVGKESWLKSTVTAGIGFLIFYGIFIWGLGNSYPDSLLYQLAVALGITS